MGCGLGYYPSCFAPQVWCMSSFFQLRSSNQLQFGEVPIGIQDLHLIKNWRRCPLLSVCFLLFFFHCQTCFPHSSKNPLNLGHFFRAALVPIPCFSSPIKSNTEAAEGPDKNTYKNERSKPWGSNFALFFMIFVSFRAPKPYRRSLIMLRSAVRFRP